MYAYNKVCTHNKWYKDMQDILDFVRYDHSCGNLYWKALTKGSNANVGDECGNGRKRKDGYKQFQFKGKKYLTHRVIYFIITGERPSMIDHIDGNRSNNVASNLREADNSRNRMNSKIAKNNTSGVKGVSFHISKNRWVSSIKKQGKLVHSKVFKTLDEAKADQLKARALYHVEYANNG